MKGPSSQIRFNEAKKLLDYGFSNYEYKKLGEQGDIVKKVLVEKGVEDSIDAIFEAQAGVLIKKGQEKSIIQEINIPDRLSAPIERGQKIGEVIFTLENKELARINIIANKEVKPIGFFNNSSHVLERWFNLCRST